MRFDGSPFDEALFRRMRDSMTHRGPDDAGTLLRHPVGLGHRRLSIVDLSPAGHQPMCNEDGTIWIVFNGEIYNYVELAAGLRARGHQFRSSTDTEVILHLYEELGERCVHELNGMFAFLLWDERKGRLFGARDRIGIKPFYYYLDEHQFVCASEIKAILEDPSVARAPDRNGLADYLFAGSPLAGKTLFSGISELMPGHWIDVRNGRARVSQYWDLKYEYSRGRSAAEFAAELTDLLDDAVRIHCRSDAEVGCHLSGGLDSSTVVGFANRYLKPLRTFSIKFDGGGYYDETAYAKIVSEFVGSQYWELTGASDMLSQLYAPLLWHMDQPPAGNGDAGFSYYMAARLAANHVKVTLTGHGGDEVFAGYPAQFQTAFGTIAAGIFNMPRTHTPFLNRVGRTLKRDGLTGILKRLSGRVAQMKPATPEQLWVQLHCNGLPPADSTLHRDFVRGLAEYSPLEDYLKPFTGAPTDQLLDRCIYHDLRVFLPQLLHKEDRASMAVSIESRVPLVDYRIVELMATVPPEQKVPGHIPKALLRQAAQDRLPESIIQRRDKSPFPVPLENWIARDSLFPLSQSVLNSSACLDRGIFDPNIVRGGTLQPGEIIRILNVELWFRLFIDRDPLLLAQSQEARNAARANPKNSRHLESAAADMTHGLSDCQPTPGLA